MKWIMFGLAMAAIAVPGMAEDLIAEKGRAVFEAHRDAVVTIESIISISFGGESQEQEGWANATVISPDGLAVLALSALDPTTMAERMGNMPGEMNTQIASLKMRLPSGGEVSAEVVLRDIELDLVYVKPTEALEEPLPYVNLDDAASPDILESVVAITQLGEVARRAHTVFAARIEAKVERPRPYYIIGSHRSNDVMCSPVFDLEGKFVGIGAMRTIRTGKGRQFGDNMLIVIVPVDDIRDGVEQAAARLQDDAEEE